MSTLESTTTEFRVSNISGTLPNGRQAVNDLPSAVALADGGYVVVWRYVRDGVQGPLAISDIHAQRFDATGAEVGPEILVNSTLIFYNGGHPSVAALGDGGFVITWDAPMRFSSEGAAAMDVDQLGQRFDRSGNAVGTQFQVNESPSLFDHASEPTALSGGGFVVTWTADESVAGTGNVPHVYMQLYDAAGVALGGDTRITGMSSINADTAALSDGGFAVAWSSDNRTDLYLQRFDSTGVAAGPVVQLNSPGAAQSAGPEIAALRDGGFAVAWVTGYSPTGPEEIVVQRFDSAGTRIGPETRLAVDTTFQSPQVAATADGGFIVDWTVSNGAGTDVFAQQFDSAGAARGGPLLITHQGSGNAEGAIAAGQDGSLLFVWTELNAGFDVYAERFALVPGLEDLPIHAGTAGVDTAVLFGMRNDYDIGQAPDGSFTIRFANSPSPQALVLQSIERLQFDDWTVTLTAGDAARSIPKVDVDRLIELYIAYVDRVPEADGLAFWINAYRGGMTLQQMGDYFYNAAVQYPALTGFSAGMSDADFVTRIYHNVLGRSDPDAQGLAFWTQALATGQATHGTLVSAMLQSAHTFKGDATYGYVADLLDNKIAVGFEFAINQGLSGTTPGESIARGMAIADAITPSDTTAAIQLIGITDDLNLYG